MSWISFFNSCCW